ncbi:hypothetical protein [Klebsiella pneumoniae]|uniref:hypothetical protein n=1 Tax=Klebsiella pneumoniae TaxID=573 RepID=UPI003970D2B2
MVHQSDSDELSALRAENARLISLLDAHGIEWRLKRQAPVQKLSTLSTDDKVALFRRLFRGGMMYGLCAGKVKTAESRAIQRVLNASG